MPSARFIKAIMAPNSSDCVVELLTLTHTGWPAPLRFCNGGADIVSNGETFYARAMQIALPGESAEGGARRGRAIIDDVERDLVALLRSIPDSPGARVDVVLTAFPDDLELSWPGMSVTADAPTGDAVELELTTRDDTVETFPVQSYSPVNAPGLYA